MNLLLSLYPSFVIFLDIKITTDNNKFMTSVYRKPTFSRVFTNIGSFIWKPYKYNLLKWLQLDSNPEPLSLQMNTRPLTIWPNWPNDWAVFWVLICTVHLTECSCHITYSFQSESTLYSCLNVKELLARSRREIWSLSDQMIECSFTN